MSTLVAWIDGISVIGPGLDDWAGARGILRAGAPLADAATTIPALGVLPPAERRRVGTGVRLALASGLQACAAAGADPATLATVFASSGGDGTNCHAICETLASDDRLISPIRFHNSVNNAASGYWGIATGAVQPSAIISAYDGSFAAGLLEALVQLATPDETDGRVLLVAHDTPYPQPLNASRPMGAPFAISLLLSASPAERSIARVEASLGGVRAAPLEPPGLEALRLSAPAARGLSLLQAIATLDSRGPASVVLDYHDGLGLCVAVRPPA